MVTRGLYPRLVRRNVKKHLDTMAAAGVDNFVVEVVTVSENPHKLYYFNPRIIDIGYFYIV